MYEIAGSSHLGAMITRYALSVGILEIVLFTLVSLTPNKGEMKWGGYAARAQKGENDSDKPAA